jgi:hypothetical protein
MCTDYSATYNSFNIATWYRQPNFELDIFSNFELFLFKIKCDMENKELILVGDLYCDVNKTSS